MQLVLGGDVFQQAAFPDEAAAMAGEILGEADRRCHAPDECTYEWILDGGSRFQIDGGGWVIWGEPVVRTFDDRIAFADFEGDPEDFTTIAAAGPYWTTLHEGVPSTTCSLMICFKSTAGNSQFGQEAVGLISHIYDLPSTLDGRALVIGTDPMPQYNTLEAPYPFADGQEVWVEPGFTARNGIHWVHVVTDDHRSVAIPMDRLRRVGDSENMLVALRQAREVRISALVEEYGPLDVLQLRANGIGPIDFGTSPVDLVDGDLVDVVSAALGEPTMHFTNDRYSPSVQWRTDQGDDFWLSVQNGVLVRWHLGDHDAEVSGEFLPGPLHATSQVSFEGAGIPLAFDDLNLTGPWGRRSGDRVVSQMGIHADFIDGAAVHLYAEGPTMVEERWISEVTEGPSLLAGLSVGERVWADYSKVGVSEAVVYVFTDDNRVGWVFDSDLSVERP